MPPTALIRALDHVRTAAGRPAPLDDGLLLARFAAERDEAAFAELVRRHGPLVRGIARRRLADAHEADDVAQATFLELARHAGRLGRDRPLAGWLFTVAHRLAGKAQRRRQIVMRACRLHEQEAGGTPALRSDPLAVLTARELVSALDDELARLPERYRLPLVLCALEGLSRDEAASRLGWTLGALRGRLERGRELLRQRLTARGLTVPAVLAGGLLASPTEAMPAALVRNMVRAAMTVPPAGIPTKLLVVAAIALAAVGVGTGAALLPASQPTPQAAPPASPPVAHAPGSPVAPRVDAEGVPLPPGVLARLGSTRMRHAGSVYRVEFAPDGKSLMTLATDGVRIWDASTGRQIRHFPEFDGSNRQSCFSQDGREILGILDGRPGLYVRRDIATRRQIVGVALADNSTYTAAFTRDRRRFAAGGSDKIVRIYDADNGKEVRRFTVEGVLVRGLAYSPDGRQLAVVTFADTISLFDAATGQLAGELKREGTINEFVTFAPDGRSLAALSYDNGQTENLGIDIWDIATRKHRRRISGWDVISAFHLCFSPDGTLLAEASQRPDVVLWDPATGREVRRLRTYPSVLATGFSPDGKTLAAASGSGTVTLWDVATGKLRPASADPIIGVHQLRFTDGGRLLTGTAERRITWDVATGREVARSAEKTSAYGLPVLSPDGRLVATLPDPRDANPALTLSEATTGKLVRTIPGKFFVRPFPTFTPDGRRIIVGDTENALHVFDVATGQPLATLTGHGSWVGWLAVSPDGRWLASASRTGDSTVRIWELTSYKEARQIKCRFTTLSAATFSPDGRLLVTLSGERNRAGDRSEAQLWDVATGRELRSFAGITGWARVVAFAPDGRSFATGGYGTPPRLWEVASGSERHQFTGHAGEIDSLAFAPDGHTLAASSPEAPVYLWDVYGRSEPQRPPTADELTRCWDDLANADPAVAFKAIRRLIAAPDGVAFLRDRLKPTPAVDAAKLKELITKLDSPKFADRQTAAKELDAVADRSADQLRKALAETKSPEVRRALQSLLDRNEAGTPETLRALRAVEVLEQIATPAARELLRTLAGGAPGATLTHAAADALKRLGP